jgi:hypothetical protein
MSRKERNKKCYSNNSDKTEEVSILNWNELNNKELEINSIKLLKWKHNKKIAFLFLFIIFFIASITLIPIYTIRILSKNPNQIKYLFDYYENTNDSLNSVSINYDTIHNNIIPKTNDIEKKIILIKTQQSFYELYLKHTLLLSTIIIIFIVVIIVPYIIIRKQTLDIIMMIEDFKRENLINKLQIKKRVKKVKRKKI